MSRNKKFITVYESIGGWKAVLVWWNPELGGFWEPYQTGIGAYNTREQAEAEAIEWAASEGISYESRDL